MFITTLFTIANRWRQTKRPSMDEWMNKMWHIHESTCIYNDILVSLKKKGISDTCYNMDEPMNLENIMLN